MIARPHICLRCQCSLARRSLPSTHRVAFQSTDTRPQRSRLIPIPSKPEDDEELYPAIKRPLKLSRRPLGVPKPLSEHPLGKLYGYTGQQLRENREKLDVKVLGEAAEVIVLRDSRISKHNYRHEEDADTQEGIDILAKLEEERGLVGQEEVEKNINEFRPKQHEHPQTRDEFSEILKSLQSGFTVSQLARYIQAHGQKDTTVLESSNCSPLLRISSWIPGISESNDRLDNDQLRGYDLQSYTSKQRLVLRLLRECWKLELPFVEEGIGQIEIELKPGDLDLILKGSVSPLSSIHSKYIVERGDKLESFRSKDKKQSRNAIRITTTRTKSYSIVQEIKNVLKGIHKIQIPLRALMPQPNEGEQSDFRKWVQTQFDDSLIEELGRITGTDIRKTPGGTLFVSSVEHSLEQVRSTRPDVALRLLLTSSNFSGREASWVGCKDAPNAVKGNFVPYPLVEGLAWPDKLRRWARWVAPTSKEVEPQHNSNQTSEKNEKNGQAYVPNGMETQDDHNKHEKLSISDATNEDHVETEPKVDLRHTPYPTGWSDDFRVESSALMGSVLYSQSQIPFSAASFQSSPQFADAIRCFSTAVPNISRILTTALSSGGTPSESVVMRFLPNPFSLSPTEKGPLGSAALSVFPPIEMRFTVELDTKALALNFIRATMSAENSDLMLPDSPMDVRFQQRVTSRLFCNRFTMPQGIADFLHKSNLSLDFKQGILSTPPSLMIPIAPFLCNPPGFEVLGRDKKDVEIQDVEYLFTGLEIRKTVSMEFEGWRLLYTSVEAGKAGGRRGELRICPTRTVKADDPEIETEQGFLESVFKLADASYTPTSVRKVMLENSRSVPTYKGNSPDRIFKFFAKRPRIMFEVDHSDKAQDETGEEICCDET